MTRSVFRDSDQNIITNLIPHTQSQGSIASTMTKVQTGESRVQIQIAFFFLLQNVQIWHPIEWAKVLIPRDNEVGHEVDH